MPEEKGTKFVVDLGNLKLPLEVQRRISSEIQQAVMREIAQLDFKGDVEIRLPWKHGPIGIIARPKVGTSPRLE